MMTQDVLEEICRNLPFEPFKLSLGTKQFRELSDSCLKNAMGDDVAKGNRVGDLLRKQDLNLNAYYSKHGCIVDVVWVKDKENFICFE